MAKKKVKKPAVKKEKAKKVKKTKEEPVKKPVAKKSTARRKRKKIVDRKEVAMDFVTKVHEKFDRMLKASILFGSQTKDTAKPTSDIDIIFIIDDAGINWDLELIAWYREELGKIIAKHAREYGREFHINTVKLTTWWEDLLHGDPVVVNIIRYGEALIDSGGFFEPLKALLIQGRMRATTEAAYAALRRAPTHIARSKASELGAIEGVYWSMVDSAQAALITAGKLPPSPEHISQMLKQNFVDTGVMKIDFVRAYNDLYALHKSIAHGEIADIQGVEIDQWQDRAEKFLSEMTRIINRLIELRTHENGPNKYKLKEEK